jgi:AraC-like DNA-binding protein
VGTEVSRPPRSKSSKKARASAHTSLPVAYPRLVLEIAAEYGITPEAVLGGTGLRYEQFEAAEFRISSRQAAQMVHNAIQLTGNPALGLEFGLRTRPTAHGFLGYAAMSSSTLREAMLVVGRYYHMRARDVSLSFSVQGDQAVVEASETHTLGPLRQLFYECLMIGFARDGGALLGQEWLASEIWFDWPEPPYFAAYRSRLPPVRFSMPAIQLRFPAKELDRRLQMADPLAARQALAQVQREAALSGGDLIDIVGRVRAELVPGAEGYPGLEVVSARLFMSSRTLKRRLQARGASYQRLLEEARRRDALRLLQSPDMELQQIAAVLGYRDPPSFTRAFRRWTGQAPSTARAQLSRPRVD